MTGLLNGDFEIWSGGTDFFLPLSDGTQLADDWFWHNGSNSSAFLDIVRTGTSHTGTYAIDLETTGATFASNTDTYIYQDITPFSSYLGTVVQLDIWAACFTGTGTDAVAIFLDDGITTSYSANSTSTSYAHLTVSHAVSMSATRLRVGLLPAVKSSGSLSYLWDTATLTPTSTLILSLSDSVSANDAMTDAFSLPLSDSISSSDSAPQAFSVQSDFVAPVVTPVVEQLVNQLTPAVVKTYFRIQE